MKIKSFLLSFFSPIILIFFISYTSSFISSGMDQILYRSGPGSTFDNVFDSAKSKENKKFIREFIWDITENKTIITQLSLSEVDIRTEMDNFGVNLKIKHPSYIRKRGFIQTRKGLHINYKTVFDNSSANFNELSPVVTFSADIKNNEDPSICFLKFVQNIRYKVPPKFFQGKYIMEFFPPLNCLYRNYGDCDTKAILLASLLEGASFRKERMVIIVLKGFGIFHAILAIERIPLPGMLSFYIDRMGPFIPMETTIKGWMPGFTNRQVNLCLQNGQFRFVKLF